MRHAWIWCLALLCARSGLAQVPGEAVFVTPDPTPRPAERDVHIRLGDRLEDAGLVPSLGLNAVRAGVDNTGAADVLNALTNLTKTTNAIYLPPGRYRFTGYARMDHGKLRGSGPDTVLVLDGLDSGLRFSATDLDLADLTIEGQMTEPQYRVEADYSDVAAAWTTPTYQEGIGGTDPNVAGSDWTHTLSGNLLTLSLASLNVETIRRVTSAPIALNPSTRYVVEGVTNCVTQFGALRKIFFYLYDSGGGFIGTFDPKNASTWWAWFTGASSVRIGVALQRFTNSPTANDTTIFRTDGIRFLALTNQAALVDTGGNPDATHFLAGSCTNAVMRRVTFRNLSRTPAIFADCRNLLIEDCRVENCVQGFNITGGDFVTVNNCWIDLRQKVSDGTVTALKHLRWRGIQSGGTWDLTTTKNTIRGASWGMEGIPGQRWVAAWNDIEAEFLGISSDKGLGNQFLNNRIRLTGFFPYCGLEIVSQTNAVAAGNTITMPNASIADAFGVAIAGTGANIAVTHNWLDAPTQVYCPFAIGGPLTVEHNSGWFSGMFLWSQAAGNRVRHNTPLRRGSSVCYGEPSATVYIRSTDTGGHLIQKNVCDSGETYCFRGRQCPNVRVINNEWRIYKPLPAAFIAETVNATSWQIIGNDFIEDNQPISYFKTEDAIGDFNYGRNAQNGREVEMGNRPNLGATLDLNLSTSSAGTFYPSTFDLPFYGRWRVTVMGTLSGDLLNMIVGDWIIDWAPGTAPPEMAAVQQLGTQSSTQPSAKLGASSVLQMWPPVTTLVTNQTLSFSNVVTVGRCALAISNALAPGSGNFYVRAERVANRR